MITIEIPGSSRLEIEHLVLDYNGTIAEDGELIGSVSEKIHILSREVTIHVLTADTHGTVREKVKGLPCDLDIIDPVAQDRAKVDFIKCLNSRTVVAIGNGKNDILMLKEAVLGIGVIQVEGASTAIFGAADLVCTSIIDALDLLLHPKRLQATLRT